MVANAAGNGVASVTVTTQGTGYKVGDTITIAGSGLAGGASPADDITLTVTSAGGIPHRLRTHNLQSIKQLMARL